MNKKVYEKFLDTVILPPLLKMIETNYPENKEHAKQQFFRSPLYTVLKKEDMKYWHYNTQTLFSGLALITHYFHSTLILCLSGSAQALKYRLKYFTGAVLSAVRLMLFFGDCT